MGDRPPGLASPAGGSHQERSTTSAGDVGSEDGEDRLQDARNLAWRALNRRDRTLAELRETLKAKGCESDAVEHVLSELSELGYLDDAGYARRFAEDRRRLDAWGRERIARRLQALGVAAEHIAAALDEQDADTELQRALELLDRRFAAVSDDRQRSRALGMLVRRGYDADVAYEALRRHTRD